MFDKRLNVLRELMAREGLECVVLVPGANLFYFTGLRKSMSERPIVAFVPLEGPLCLVLPVIEAPEARAALTFEMEMHTYSDEEGHLPAFRRVCGELGLAGRRLGVEYLTMRVLEQALIEQCAPGVQLADADGLFSELRIIKDATEIEAMRQAAHLNEQAYARLREHIVPGRTEKELAALLRIAAWEVGAEGIAFDPIIVAGLNSASPHSHPGDHVLQTYELVVVDFGVTYGGYCSDITRTYATWRVSPEMASVHRAVYEANAAARAAVRPGVTAQEVAPVQRFQFLDVFDRSGDDP